MVPHSPEHFHPEHLQVTPTLPPEQLIILSQFHSLDPGSGHLTWHSDPFLLAPSLGLPTPPLLPAVPADIHYSVNPRASSLMVGPHCLQERIQPPGPVVTLMFSSYSHASSTPIIFLFSNRTIKQLQCTAYILYMPCQCLHSVRGGKCVFQRKTVGPWQPQHSK